eukprot:2128243-Lingulodinium_polyedra.AAC.1
MLRNAICEYYPGVGPWICWKRAQYSRVNQTADIERLENRGGEKGSARGPLVVCADLAVQTRRVR